MVGVRHGAIYSFNKNASMGEQSTRIHSWSRPYPSDSFHYHRLHRGSNPHRTRVCVRLVRTREYGHNPPGLPRIRPEFGRSRSLVVVSEYGMHPL